MEVDAAALVRGLSGKAPRERLELIEWLLRQGFDLAQIRGALVPVLLPANRVIGDDGTHASVSEICAATGFDEELLRRLHRAVGIPVSDALDAGAPLRADAESVLRTRTFIDLGFDADEVVTIVRVLVEGFGHAAEAMRSAALKAVLQPGATEVELAKSFEALAHRLVPALGPMVMDLLYLQLRRSWETEAVSLAERATGSLPRAHDMAVAFADIVGFTELGEAVTPEHLEGLSSQLTELTRGALVPPVRLVKTIGDAVMVVSSDAHTLVEVVLEIVDQAAQQDMPRLRVGVACGSMVSRAGDWFGSPVNLASRITEVAPPGSVVVADSVRQKLSQDAFDWSPLGEHTLKGVGGVVRLTVVRRRGNS